MTLETNVIEYDRVEKAFNSKMMEIFQGSNLNEIVDEMLAHMMMQIETQHWQIVGSCSMKFYI